MITVEEALEIISTCQEDFGTERISLHQSIGRISAEDWFTDRAMPPYDRVMMDGIAIQYKTFETGLRKFVIEGIAPAGSAQLSLFANNSCIEVMTGCVLPMNTDTVIRYEDVVLEDGFATIQIDEIREYQNVHHFGTDRKKGERIVAAGTQISAAEIGVGASLGLSEILVKKLPKVIVISTGDELVEIDEIPAEYQIRKSNVYRIETALKSMGISAETSHLNDDKVEMKSKLSEYLENYDAIILSGGVSKGKFDFLPEVLADLGVDKLFHRIKQRPGKPFWFGKKGNCTVFALPGNPISSFMCTEKYFTFWYHLCMRSEQPATQYAVLESDVDFKPDLAFFVEVQLISSSDGRMMAKPMRGNGSGDLSNLAKADGFLELEAGRDLYQAGEVFPFIRYR